MMMGDGTDPMTAYDENGNIKAMKQWGLKITGSSLIDDLTYEYNPSSNKLKRVSDAITGNNKLGDFTDYDEPVFHNDYEYDGNGNLIKDANKGFAYDGGLAPSINYNHLNLPYSLEKEGYGTITYIYDALGNKLEKRVHDNTNTAAPNKTTTYLGPFVYENDELQFISHEEGRFRYTKTATEDVVNSDYFIKDHLGNVRMVLTDEIRQDKYPIATLEDQKLPLEESYYAINRQYIVASSSVTGLNDVPYRNDDNSLNGSNPSDPAFESKPSEKVYMLNKNGAKMGLGMTLKVMAGDRLDIKAKSYYNQSNSGGSTVNGDLPILDILNGLVGGPGGVVASTAHEAVTGSQLNGLSTTTQGIQDYLKTPETSDVQNTTRPKAYINYIFFDEQFRYAGSGYDKVADNPGMKNHSLLNIPVPKNGYVYI
jgi:hypothetical protein